MALNTQNKAGQECNLDQPNALNRKWWDTDDNYHTIEKYIVKLIDTINQWQDIIDEVQI